MDGKPIKVCSLFMKVMENDKVVTQATQNDPRVTKVGAFAPHLAGRIAAVYQCADRDVDRRSRPHAVAHNEQYRQLIEGYMLRHKVKPGITGWAQINGWRGETDTLEKMENVLSSTS